MALTSLGVALGIAFFSAIQVVRIAENAAPTRDANSADRLLWLVATSLTMCLVGVTNSMLMSVTERYREIGTIKCLGASDTFIVKVFFLEAVLLGSIGSLTGAIVGAGLTALASGAHLSAAQFGGVLAISTLLGLVLTVAASVAPAIQAARMPAAAALRVEI